MRRSPTEGRPYGSDSELRLRGLALGQGARIDFAIDGLGARSNPDLDAPDYVSRLFEDAAVAGTRDFPDDRLFYPGDFGGFLENGPDGMARTLEPIGGPTFDRFGLRADLGLLEPDRDRYDQLRQRLGPDSDAARR